jgi:FAD/FMN-containing dehydrogenase
MTHLCGWGANLCGDCVLVEPHTPSEVQVRLDRSGTIARGLGRSYGDAAINAGGQVLGMTRVDRYRAFDERTGIVTCEAGISLGQIISDLAPRGWFPMITPGTKFVTIGGCIANDVHGKAHHSQGAFSSCVEAMTVLLANGEIVRASRTENPDLFWGNFGGMGLLGIVLTTTLRLRKIETTYFRQKAVRANDLDEMLAILAEYDSIFPYSVGTIDIFARGARLGRGVVVFGDHAKREELPSALADRPLRIASSGSLGVPFELPDLTLNGLSMRVVNALIQRSQAEAAAFGLYEGFFYPLDRLRNWNRAYGRRGFTQYQLVIPYEDGARNLRRLLEAIFSAGERPFLNVLKRLGRQSEGYLSFPREGYTLAIDFPIRATTPTLLKRLDAMVIEAGGRVYLGKDAYLDAATFHRMYPATEAWLAIKAKYDPDGVFTSNLARRVGLAAPGCPPGSRRGHLMACGPAS